MHEKYVTFGGRVVIVGFGVIGQGVLPLLLRHINLRPQQIVVITADERGLDEALKHGIQIQVVPVGRENYRALLDPLVGEGDFLLNLAVEVSSAALISLCQDKGALYLDIGIEPWTGYYADPTATPSARSNYRLREEILELRARDRPTAVLTHGANPGWVSHFVKQALIDVARECGNCAQPEDQNDWAQLARDLNIRVIQIAERDWQISEPPRRPGEFVNTWSVHGLINESIQPAELGWGSHEKQLPADGHHHGYGRESAIYLTAPGAETKVRSWTPLAGSFDGLLITHGESISIADYLTLGSGRNAEYRPTVYYAYRPCDDALSSLRELTAQKWRMHENYRVVRDQIVEGVDELGVLLLGHPRGAYWYGSRLSHDHARRLAPCNSATSLQVSAGVLAGVVWAVRNPARGIVEPEDLPFDQMIALCRPYLGEVVGTYSDWTPLSGGNGRFSQHADDNEAWQFRNFRVDDAAFSPSRAANHAAVEEEPPRRRGSAHRVGRL